MDITLIWLFKGRIAQWHSLGPRIIRLANDLLHDERSLAISNASDDLLDILNDQDDEDSDAEMVVVDEINPQPEPEPESAAAPQEAEMLEAQEINAVI